MAGPRGQVRATRGTRGNIQQLLLQPRDIIDQIFIWLHPLDLLRMSWTTKALRKYLMSRESRWIWRETLKTIEGLPPCPEDLIEPAYIRLLFDTRCYFCLSRAQKVYWNCRTRCCSTCFGYRFVMFLDTLDVPKAFYPDFLNAVPCDLVTRNGRTELFFGRAEGEELLKQFMQVYGDKEELAKFVLAKQERKRSIAYHAQACVIWEAETRRRRSDELHDIRQERERAIRERLGALGWTAELRKLDEWKPGTFSAHQHVRETKVLTDKGWAAIQAELERFLDDMRAQRETEERRRLIRHRQAILAKVVQAYASSLRPDQLLPSVADFCDMEEFQALMESPEDYHVHSAMIQLIPRLRELAFFWRGRAENFLLSLVPWSPYGLPGYDIRRLDLATTWFKCVGVCTGCDEILNYPRILCHHHMTALNYAVKDRSAEQWSTFKALGHEPWNFDGKKIAHHAEAAEVAATLVRLGGHSSSFTFAKDMDALDWRFMCNTCSTNSTLYCMTWRTAIEHALKQHTGNIGHISWTKLDDASAAYIRTLERLHEREIPSIRPPIACCCREASTSYFCGICRARVPLQYMSLHFRSMHGVEGVDHTSIYRDPDSPDIHHRCVVRVLRPNSVAVSWIPPQVPHP